ncbi:MAG: SUMF1/EgtB/PvdO family nonheme iron enzyme [Planctomycetes bacterium]|nr:SUMF1/EgtB/PvdO family nonheme iron enzyme [Planctomycetota bacterium]
MGSFLKSLHVNFTFLIVFVLVGSVLAADGYEPDDSNDLATLITTDGVAQFHSIDPFGDEDWLTFSVTSAVPSIVLIKIGGVSGNTEMWLYDDGDLVTAVAYDDDSGAGQLSRIHEYVSAGTYYIRIHEKNDAETISEYSVSVLTYAFPDFVVDGVVDGEDLAFFVSYWCESDPNLAADINADGTVNIKDFGLLSAHWLEENIPWISIPGGTFSMGGLSGDQLAVHEVTLSDFGLSKYETTNKQYAEYLNAALIAVDIVVDGGVVYAADDTGKTEPYFNTDSASIYSLIEYSGGSFIVLSKIDGIDDVISMDNFPVNEVSWFGAKAFCDYYGYQLPTEAQWEYAARGGNTAPTYIYPWDSDTASQAFGNFYSGDFANPHGFASEDYPYFSTVGYYGVYGAYGLCDMGGNVSEWCSDWYKPSYASGAVTDPTGPTDDGKGKVIRGGGWNLSSSACTVYVRDNAYRDNLIHNRGFRICSTVPVEE